MPELLRIGPYRFLFHSREHDPPHVHVRSPGASAVYLLDAIERVRASGYSRRQREQIEEILDEHRDEFLRRWHEYFAE